MSSRPSLISLATLGILGVVAYQAGRKTTEVFGADASPSDVERAMVENPAIVPTISPIGLDSGHSGALYRDIQVGTRDTLRNDAGGLGVRPVVTDVMFDSAFASGYSRVTDLPYEVVSHEPVNLQPSFTQYGGGPYSTRPNMNTYTVDFEAEHGEEGTEDSPDPVSGAPYTDSTSYGGNSGAVEGVELNEIDSYEKWNQPCCRVCPPGAEAWCDAINNPAPPMPKGQRLSPYQNSPLLADPYTLKATTPQQNNSYVGEGGEVMSIGGWSQDYDISVMSDYNAKAVARDGSHTMILRRV